VISPATNLLLLDEIKDEEVRRVVWSLEPENVPETDRFSIDFYRLYWNTIKNDMLRMLNHNRIKRKIGGSANSSFLSIIPKESNPTNFSRFYPISLYNSSYKILNKIIANIVKHFLSSFISKNQGGIYATQTYP